MQQFISKTNYVTLEHIKTNGGADKSVHQKYPK